jgi:hypothetical protein
MIISFLTTAGYATTPPTDTAFLTDLYENALNRTPDAAGMNGYLSLLASGETRSQVVAAFINLAEFGTVQSNRIPNDTSAMPPDTPPTVLSEGPTAANGTGYPTNQATGAEVVVTDPNGATYISGGNIWFVSTDANGNVQYQCPISFTTSPQAFRSRR